MTGPICTGIPAYPLGTPAHSDAAVACCGEARRGCKRRRHDGPSEGAAGRHRRGARGGAGVPRGAEGSGERGDAAEEGQEPRYGGRLRLAGDRLPEAAGRLLGRRGGRGGGRTRATRRRSGGAARLGDAARECGDRVGGGQRAGARLDRPRLRRGVVGPLLDARSDRWDEGVPARRAVRGRAGADRGRRGRARRARLPEPAGRQGRLRRPVHRDARRAGAGAAAVGRRRHRRRAHPRGDASPPPPRRASASRSSRGTPTRASRRRSRGCSASPRRRTESTASASTASWRAATPRSTCACRRARTTARKSGTTRRAS